MSLRAQLEVGPDAGERRSASRRKLRLESEGYISSAPQTQVVIHDLSEDGLLVESPVVCRLLRSPGPDQPQENRETVEKALIELESLSFAIKRITRVVDKAIDQLTKK